jgi:ABC-type phosphate transport system substrate-binding protein
MEIIMIRRPMTAAAAAVGLGLSAWTASASALPAPAATEPSAAGSSATQVQYRDWDGRYDGRRHWRRDRWSRGVGPFLGGLAAGAIIGGAASGYGSGTAGAVGGDAYARCSAQFRSFDPSTGTYTTYGGETRVCPYLQ